MEISSEQHPVLDALSACQARWDDVRGLKNAGASLASYRAFGINADQQMSEFGLPTFDGRNSPLNRLLSLE